MHGVWLTWHINSRRKSLNRKCQASQLPQQRVTFMSSVATCGGFVLGHSVRRLPSIHVTDSTAHKKKKKDSCAAIPQIPETKIVSTFLGVVNPLPIRIRSQITLFRKKTQKENQQLELCLLSCQGERGREKSKRKKETIMSSQEDVSTVVDELIEVVLPKCALRPGVYNRVAKFTRKLEKMEEQTLQEKSERYQMPYEPKSRSYVYFLPKNHQESEASNTLKIHEQGKDVVLLKLLVSKVESKTILHYLNALLQQAERELRSMEETQRERMERKARQAEVDAEVYRRVLKLVQDRPHVYNFCVLQLEKTLSAAFFGNTTTTTTTTMAFMSGCLPRRGGGGGGPAPVVPLLGTVSFLAEPPATSRDRWLDVMRLDEILDGCLADDQHSNAKQSLQDFKKLCGSKAKTLQRQEVRRMTHTMASSYHYPSNPNKNTRAVH